MPKQSECQFAFVSLGVCKVVVTGSMCVEVDHGTTLVQQACVHGVCCAWRVVGVHGCVFVNMRSDDHTKFPRTASRAVAVVVVVAVMVVWRVLCACMVLVAPSQWFWWRADVILNE